HTGALAGSAEAYASLFRRTGVIEVGDMDEFVETAALCIGLHRRPARGGVAVIGVSGGGVAHVADIAQENGLALPAFSPRTVATLTSVLPPFATPQNPLDTTGAVFADASVYTRVLEAVAADPAIGLIVAAQDAPPGLDEAGAGEYLGIAGAIADFAAGARMPTVLMSNLSAGHHRLFRERAGQGILVLNGTRAALKAIAHVMPRGEAPIPACTAREEPDPRWRAVLSSGKRLSEGEAKAFLAAHGLPVTRETLAASAREAAAAAGAIGYPVVMKIASPDLPHKTEAGGVRLAIADAGQAARAFEEIMRNARAYAPQAELHGVLVQETVSGGVEALVGLVRHEPFGLGVVVGIGGVMVELVADAAFELLPVDRDAALAMIGRTKLAPLLAGYRGAPACDVPALADAVAALSRLGETYGDHIAALDLNPVAVLPAGRGVRILDALIR
ncbi:acetate--CoA ligase family protein, partial [Aureimonas populi]